MEVRDFLLQLSLTPGLTQKHLTVLVTWLEEHPQAVLPLSWLAICQLLSLTPQQAERGKATYGSPRQYQQMKCQYPFIAICDANYPVLLKEIYQPPVILYYDGDLRALQLPLVALVGARKVSTYGQQVLKPLIRPLQTSGIGIVSGLALGVDYLVHQQCIEQRAVPIGVIGTSLDIAYPKSSTTLQHQVAQTGIVLSEYPVGTGPRKHHFPARNRIIAGLCQTTVVIEAAENSGSLITANLALQENRNVLAVPGPINAVMSVGCNQLIAIGAGCILRGEDILSEMRLNNI